MSDAPPPATVKARRSGCQWLVLIVATLTVLTVAAFISLVFYLNFFYRKEKKLHPQTVLKDLRLAITTYETDYGHYPIPDSDSHGLDVTIRSRGPMLTALMGSAATPLNPRGTKFIDLPRAKDQKFGLWQNKGEWVLSDLWGEPYYIILDTDKNEQVANPEFGASTSDPKWAEINQKYPPPQKLPMTVAIYSSGPDRDPKTWHDNVCSWRWR